MSMKSKSNKVALLLSIPHSAKVKQNGLKNRMIDSSCSLMPTSSLFSWELTILSEFIVCIVM